MKCPYCQHPDSRVLESRPTEEGAAIRRRRACLLCDERFTTYERVETTPLLRGMLIACQKRAVPLSVLEETAARIEADIRNRLEPEVSTEVIGEMVMDALRAIDEVAYVRFASVYKEFRDLSSFLQEIEKMHDWAKYQRIAEKQQTLFEG